VTEPRVGNGGFALMNVQAALRALRNRYRLDPIAYGVDLLLRHSHRVPPLLGALETRRTTHDLFFALDAPQYVPGYSVAPLREGLRFAFETAPRACFELNDRQLPFGCHAWWKFDRAFWQPFLLPETAGLA